MIDKLNHPHDSFLFDRVSGVPERTDAHDLNLMRRLANQIATALSQAGVKVMLCDIEEAALAKALADLKLTNADVDGVKADVSVKKELQAAADATVARYNKVHILVNNAGVGGGGSYGRWTDASWNWTLGVRAAFSLETRSGAFDLRAQGWHANQ
jgi:NAD(P)-dependent dehydrogenase (short-subunit alcohol dehydrogenase family)